MSAVLLLAAGLARAASLPGANGCERMYDTWIRDGENELVSSLATGTSTGLGSLGMMLTVRDATPDEDVAASMSLSGSTAATGFTTAGVGAHGIAERRSLSRALRAIQQARVGDGFALRDLSVAVEVTGQEAPVPRLASLLAGARGPCEPRPKDWEELVIWTREALAAPVAAPVASAPAPSVPATPKAPSPDAPADAPRAPPTAPPTAGPPAEPPPVATAPPAAPPPERPAERPSPGTPRGPVEMLDSDGDGIVDARDAAPQAREDRDGFQDDDGAPDPDNDSDGVLDAADLCPGVAAGAGASVRGCPDGDGDGFVGAADLCPTVAPSPGEVARLSRGCAARPGEVYAREEVLASGARVTVIVLPVPVAFDAAGALTPAARAGIDAARTWLVVNPRAARVEVVAHTDDREAPAKERAARTQARADAVRTALLEGVPPLRVEPSRVSARGAGDSEPLRAGTSAAARAANRRVELRVLEEAPPGAGEP